MNKLYSTHNRSCPICNCSEKQLLFRQSFSAFENNLLNGYNVVSCEGCGFCYSDNIPEQEVFDIYYREMSKYEHSDTNVSESKYDLNRFWQIVEYIKSNIKSRNGCIVEIGCASGLLLSLMKQERYDNILGIDPSPGCVHTVRTRYEIPAMVGTISDLSFLKPNVDLLILVGVLEHIRDVNIALEELKKVLKPDGKLCIVVPDASRYLEGKDAPFQEFSVEHINFFGPESISNLMGRHDFSVVNIEQHDFEVNYNTITPVILSIFQKNEGKDSTIKFDHVTVENLRKYIVLCKGAEESIHHKIDKISQEKEQIIIWGTGAQTLRLLANSSLSEAKITAFVDSNPKYQGNTLNNVPVIAPADLKNKKETILISTRAYQNEIEIQIKETLKIPNKIIKLY
jgi:SAM-dependent methyltransferase